jgi:beta-fructofuranosidase
MNDPNGPICFQGRYHMFYQYNPHGAFWGSMHWGHATSPDMVHWQHAPLALAPTPGGYDQDGVFSGCAVLDRGLPTLVYTGVEPPATPAQATLRDGSHSWREVQCVAVSHDALRSWRKLEKPVIAAPPPGLAVTGFRDPCVWREEKEWRMALGSGFAGKGGAILLYRSPDLRRWTYLHPLTEGKGTGQPSANPVDNGEMWECPEFFPLGDRHVLLISTMGKVLWKSGSYAGGRFSPDQEGEVDSGAYYAARTMLDCGGQRILWGWIPERRPEPDYRAAGWAGVMSLPRLVSLGSGGRLHMAPAPALEALRGEHTQISSGKDSWDRLSGLQLRHLAGELRIEFLPDQAFLFQLRSGPDQPFLEITYDPLQTGRELRLNGSRSALAPTAQAPMVLRLFVDGSVVELFGNHSSAITERVYRVPQTPLQVIVPRTNSLLSLDVWQMRPISIDRLTR